MYVPEQFREDDIKVLHETMQSIGHAIVIGTGPEGLIATHVPVELASDEGEYGTLRCHFTRPNPHCGVLRDGQEVLVIFQGPAGYVSPNWYPTKQLTGKVVPTLNYVAVHAYGTAKTFEDGEKLRAHLEAMTNRFESAYAVPWKVSEAPDDFIQGMLRAIIGIEIRLARLEGKWKMSQNRSETDAKGVVNGFNAQGDEASRKLAEIVEDRNGLGENR